MRVVSYRAERAGARALRRGDYVVVTACLRVHYYGIAEAYVKLAGVLRTICREMKSVSLLLEYSGVESEIAAAPLRRLSASALEMKVGAPAVRSDKIAHATNRSHPCINDCNAIRSVYSRLLQCRHWNLESWWQLHPSS